MIFVCRDFSETKISAAQAHELRSLNLKRVFEIRVREKGGLILANLTRKEEMPDRKKRKKERALLFDRGR